MAYADQKMSGNKVTALIIVALIHIAAIYALVSGLAYEAFTKVKERVTAVDIKEEKPPEEKPPPPPPEKPVTPPPIVAPPPPIAIPNAAPQVQTVPIAPPPPPIQIPVAAPPPPPPPAAPAVAAKRAVPRGTPGTWVTPEDYPAGPLREQVEGVTGFRLDIDATGRATNCAITRSSGNAELDSAACRYLLRRARFAPANDAEGNKVGDTYSNSIRWVIPKD